MKGKISDLSVTSLLLCRRFEATFDRNLHHLLSITETKYLGLILQYFVYTPHVSHSKPPMAAAAAAAAAWDYPERCIRPKQPLVIHLLFISQHQP